MSLSSRLLHPGKLVGYLFPLLVIVVIHVATHQFGLPIANPPVILILALIYAAFVGSLPAAFVNVPVIWLYCAYFFSDRDHPENLSRVVTLLFALPIAAMLVGLLRRRIEKDSEKMIRQEHAFSNLITRSIKDGLFLCDDAGLRDVNPALCALTGFTTQELIGSHWPFPFWQQLPSETSQFDFFQDLIRDHSGECDLTFRRKDGETFPVLLSVSTLPNRPDLTHPHLVIIKDLSERQRAERQLRSVTTHARALLWQAEVKGQPGWEQEPGDPRHFQWNIYLLDEHAAQQVLPLDVPPGKDYFSVWTDVRNPQDRAYIDRQAAESFVHGKRSYSQEFRCHDRDGKPRWIYEDVVIQPTAYGQWRCFGVATDVTERKLAEEKLRNVTAHARCILSYAEVFGLPGWQDHGEDYTQKLFRWEVTIQDQRAAQQLLSLDVPPDSNYFDVWVRSRLPEDDVQLWKVSAHAFLRNQPAFSQEFRCIDKSGSIRWLHEEASIQKISEGHWQLFTVTTDVTDRKRAEETLRESESRFRQLAEAAAIDRDQLEAVIHSMIEGVIIADPAGRILTMNPAALAILGFASTAELRDHLGDMSEIIETRYPDGRPLPPEEWPLARAARGQTVTACEVHSTRRDTGKTWISSHSAMPVRNSAGEIILTVLTFHDITARKQAESDLQQAKEDAESANAAKDQFLAILSHELRTPLTPVLGKVILMKRKPGFSPETINDLEMIRRNVELEARLIGDLVDITSIARHNLHLKLEPTNIHEALLNALDIYRSAIDSKSLRLTLELFAPQPFANGDPVRLQQIFWNLIGNAIKYTPTGGSINIRSANPTPDTLRIDIADTGIGIEPGVMPRLFTAFEQGERTLSRRYGGLGLGLSICKALIDMHAGKLSATSPGRDLGATFTIELPAIPSPVAVAAPSVPQAPRRALKILLVEDNDDTLRVMTSLLKLANHQVRTASSLRAAKDALASADFDVLLCDIGLPDGTGWDLLRSSLPAHPIRAIALSGFAQDEDLARSKAAGFLEHLTKPISPEKLEAVLQAVANAPLPPPSASLESHAPTPV